MKLKLKEKYAKAVKEYNKEVKKLLKSNTNASEYEKDKDKISVKITRKHNLKIDIYWVSVADNLKEDLEEIFEVE